MTWSDFYLFCFLVGFSLSVLSFLAGAVHLHLPVKWHLPFHGGHHGGGITKGGFAKGGAHLSWFNASSILAFLAWFGGTGYLLTKHSNLVAIFCLAIAIAAGLTGRSEEHTSELQSHVNLVCRLLLEKKKKTHLNSND